MPLFFYAERRMHGNQSKTERSYFYTQKQRKERKTAWKQLFQPASQQA